MFSPNRIATPSPIKTSEYITLALGLATNVDHVCLWILGIPPSGGQTQVLLWWVVSTMCW